MSLLVHTYSICELLLVYSALLCVYWALMFFVVFISKMFAGALVLIELMVLSIVYLYAFGFVKIKPSTAPGFDGSANSTAATSTASFGAFYLSVWWLHDVFGSHWLSSDATTPLAKANAV